MQKALLSQRTRNRDELQDRGADISLHSGGNCYDGHSFAIFGIGVDAQYVLCAVNSHTVKLQNNWGFRHPTVLFAEVQIRMAAAYAVLSAIRTSRGFLQSPITQK